MCSALQDAIIFLMLRNSERNDAPVITLLLGK